MDWPSSIRSTSITSSSGSWYPSVSLGWSSSDSEKPWISSSEELSSDSLCVCDERAKGLECPVSPLGTCEALACGFIFLKDPLTLTGAFKPPERTQTGSWEFEAFKLASYGNEHLIFPSDFSRDNVSASADNVLRPTSLDTPWFFTGKDEKRRLSGSSINLPACRICPTRFPDEGGSDEPDWDGFFTMLESDLSAILKRPTPKWLGDGHVTGSGRIYSILKNILITSKPVVIAKYWDNIAKLNLTDIMANLDICCTKASKILQFYSNFP